MTDDKLFKLIRSTNKVLAELKEELVQRNLDVKTLIRNGFKIEAIVKYKKDNNCTLTESKKIIEDMSQSMGY
jgi:predicted transcriptional regulator